MAGDALGRIEHFVLLMLENRSFDNMLGWLDAPDAPPALRRRPGAPAVNGLSGAQYGNPVPEALGGGEVAAGATSDGRVPDPDPGEGYAHTHMQLYGRPPGPAEGPGVPPAPMDGFVADYVDVLAARGLAPTPERYRQVMDGFRPQTVPVISALARAYAVCDGWHASVPSQTLPNRAFSLAATSLGRVDNTPYAAWVDMDAPTICNRLQDAGLSWRVYYDRLDILPLTWLLCGSLRPYLLSHFAGMEDFRRDAAAGTLPNFALLEPRFLLDPNDQHPPAPVGPGERLIAEVHRALATGPAWERTLLLVTYDEHGGCFDHVPPPAAVPPAPGGAPGPYGFRFDRLGVRVPAVLASPWIEPGTVFRASDAAGRPAPLDHTSWLATVERRFGLAPLTARDAAAPDLAGALRRDSPRRDRPALRAPRRPWRAAPGSIAAPVAAHLRAVAHAHLEGGAAWEGEAAARLRRLAGS